MGERQREEVLDIRSIILKEPERLIAGETSGDETAERG